MPAMLFIFGWIWLNRKRVNNFAEQLQMVINHSLSTALFIWSFKLNSYCKNSYALFNCNFMEFIFETTLI